MGQRPVTAAEPGCTAPDLPATARPPGGTGRQTLASLPAGDWAWAVAAVALALATYVMFSRFLWEDNYFDLYAGRYIVHHGIPHRNVVTMAAHGAPWIDQQWLAHVLYYGAWAAGGYPGMAAVSAGLIAAAFALLALLMLHRGVPGPRMFMWMTAALVACFGNAMVFAQSFGYPLFAATLWLILEDDGGSRMRRHTWLIVPVLIFWANIHGSVMLGAALTGGYAGYRVTRALARHDPAAIPAYAALGTAAVLAVFCTPYGIGVIRYYRSLIGNPALARYLEEWAPPTVRNPFTWTFLVLALAALTAVIIAWRRGTRPGLLLGGITSALLALALTAVRNEVWFIFAACLLAAETLGRSRPHVRPVLRAAFQRMVAGVLVALALASLAILAVTPDSQFESLAPVRAIAIAADTAARVPGTRVLGDVYSSTAMLWLHPAMWGRIGFDSRFEQYSQAEVSAYLKFVYVRPGWQRVLKGYSVIVASHVTDPQLTGVLSRLPGWRVVYRDATGLVVERDRSPARNQTPRSR